MAITDVADLAVGSALGVGGIPVTLYGTMPRPWPTCGPRRGSPNQKLHAMVVDLGAAVAGARRAADAAGDLAVGAEGGREQSQHGVSLDEEMVDIVRFQRQLEAASRVMTAVWTAAPRHAGEPCRDRRDADRAGVEHARDQRDDGHRLPAPPAGTPRPRPTKRAQEALATGTWVNVPSDDPAQASRGLALRAALQSREQEVRAATHARSLVAQADGELQGAVDVLQRDTRELTVRAATHLRRRRT